MFWDAHGSLNELFHEATSPKSKRQGRREAGGPLLGRSTGAWRNRTQLLMSSGSSESSSAKFKLCWFLLKSSFLNGMDTSRSTCWTLIECLDEVVPWVAMYNWVVTPFRPALARCLERPQRSGEKAAWNKMKSTKPNTKQLDNLRLCDPRRTLVLFMGPPI